MIHCKQSRRAAGGRRRGYAWLAGVTGSAVLAIVTGMAAPDAMAQENYPSKPIKVVLGFSAGGGTDAIARALAKHMAATLGANVLIDNKPGANGNIAAEEVSRAAGDGYTLLYNTSSIASSPALYSKRLSYDVSKDLVPVALTASLPIVLVVPAKSPFKTVEELVAYAKANPGKLNYASAGNGNVTHLAALSFEDAVGIKGMHIPYKGEAPALVDLMAGMVDYYFATSAGAIPAVKSGRLKALAVATKAPLDTLPDVPTLDATVAKGLEMSAWSGVMAPAATPPAIVVKLNGAIEKALADKEVQAYFANQSAQASSSTPQEYGAFLNKEIDALAKVIKKAGVTLD
ncbi:tripartite tricarboxylate transporter substrate binding protein [Achromobacter sp. SD115]|uniref:Bug family tripartite tricarboxylate transporter substrate binding protein n=1 Tax=Achromobacter sp. SD115 TaxID=2782011 RepID=UPI001A961A53|nr:tripartite tricarboxylate transporter substrate binding protein [Achromobacter sp. SD115]MBO1014507.1 tripartite tricarboxylate transporter substrate binding protein [Achromobacter sp. SD115]